jgi:hypothetical protein
VLIHISRRFGVLPMTCLFKLSLLLGLDTSGVVLIEKLEDRLLHNLRSRENNEPCLMGMNLNERVYDPL